VPPNFDADLIGRAGMRNYCSVDFWGEPPCQLLGRTFAGKYFNDGLH